MVPQRIQRIISPNISERTLHNFVDVFNYFEKNNDFSIGCAGEGLDALCINWGLVTICISENSCTIFSTNKTTDKFSTEEIKIDESKQHINYLEKILFDNNYKL